MALPGEPTFVGADRVLASRSEARLQASVFGSDTGYLADYSVVHSEGSKGSGRLLTAEGQPM